MVYYSFIIFGAVISWIMCSTFWRRRPAEGAVPLSGLMLSATVWLVGNAFELISSSLQYKMLWIYIQYIGIMGAPLCWIWFSYEYTQKKSSLNLKTALLFLILPALSMIALITNQYHGLFYTEIALRQVGELQLFNGSYGVWFWINAFYCYGLVLAGSSMVLGKSISLSHTYRVQALLIVSAVFAPFIGNVIWTLRLVEGIIDLTPFGFVIAGMLLFWSSHRYKLMDLVPVAHSLIIENLEDIIISVDNRDRIIYMNQSALRVLGIEGERYEGRSAYEVLVRWPELTERFAGATDVYEEVSFEKPEGIKTYKLSIVPLKNRKGSVAGRIISFHDITALKLIMSRLEESHRLAESANAAKSQFLANTSHEIRTPMNGILGMLQILSDTELSEVQREYVHIARSSAESLLGIINDILDFSKIEAGKLMLEELDFDLAAEVGRAVEIIKVKAREKDLRLSCLFDSGVPLSLRGDPGRMRQVLVNLMGNAVKFTKEGKVEVKVSLLEKSRDRVLLCFEVSDTGIGIPEDRLDYIFESFSQVDSSYSRRFGGTGLGLAISRQIAELMGGSISVKSTEGEGSTFYFTVPFMPGEGVLRAAEAEADGYTRKSQCKAVSVLIADDNPVNSKLAALMLERIGMQTNCVSDGLKAVAAVEEGCYDIILMDIQMPGMNGFEAARSIRELEGDSGRYTPIVAMTAHSMEGYRQKCLDFGMDGYISKPVKKEKLYETIISLLPEK